MNVTTNFNILLLCMLCSGCASAVKDQINDPNLVICPEQRPEMCTMQYDPVCATLSDGVRKTYSSDCTACADTNVVGYKPGECK